MTLSLLVHIIGGTLGLISGFTALFAAKGMRLHRRSGRLFVFSMLVMSLSGAAIAALTSVEASVVGGLLTAYLVVTGLRTVRPTKSAGLDIALMLFALGFGAATLLLGFDTASLPKASRDGIPAAMFFLFGSVAILSGVGDVRVIRAGEISGAARLARHLWRMCFALWIAAASFFLGQADEFPQALRIPPLLATPVILVLVMMVYWLRRVRRRASEQTSLRRAA
jgi:uncharacterized membrane protein